MAQATVAPAMCGSARQRNRRTMLRARKWARVTQARGRAQALGSGHCGAQGTGAGPGCSALEGLRGMWMV